MRIIITLLFFSITLTFANQEKNNSIKSVMTDFATGAVSGAAAMTAYAPWGYFQNRKIQQLPINWKNPTHWFRGLPGLALGKAPTIAIQTVMYGYITKMLPKNEHEELTSAQHTFAATMAGGASGAVSNVTQLVAMHQQNKGTSFVKTIHAFPEQYKSLGRGINPTMLRETIFTNTYLNLLPILKKKINTYINNPKIAFTISSTMSGAIVAYTTQPFMVVIVALQADLEKKKYKNSLDAAWQLFKTGGIQAFYQGSGWRSIGVICALPVLSWVQEKMNTFLK